MLNIFLSYISLDAPNPWALYFQDSASPSQEGIIELHDHIMFYLVIIIIGVSYMLLSIIRVYNQSSSQLVHKYANHGTLIELIWTISPAIILVFIAFPSFKLLYLMDEVIDPDLTVKVLGHQWYWSYEYSDYLTESGAPIEFDSYLVPEDDLEEGQLRMLEVDSRLILPVNKHIRFIISANDVIHDFAVPSLGLKVDAIPGRLNQASTKILRTGVFYGQCSELCGVLHSAMPIVIQAVNFENYLEWLSEQVS